MLREQLQQLQARLDAQERTRVFPSLAAGTMSRRSTLSGFSTASIALKSVSLPTGCVMRARTGFNLSLL